MEYCMMCNKELPDYKPHMCCSGHECGCMGMPIEPPICSQECWTAMCEMNNENYDKDKPKYAY